MQRRTLAKPAAEPASELEQYRSYLRIDRDDLDTSLMEQPEMFHHVANACVEAGARRDEAKLELEELLAELDQSVRARALKDDEKLTETALQNRLREMPRVQEAQRRYLETRKEADRWLALKESYQQRSFMLRELVHKLVAERHDLSTEAGAGQSHRDYRDARVNDIREQAGKLRRDRRRELGD